MKTELLRVEPDPPEGDQALARACQLASECWAAGRVVALPTETVYGLAIPTSTPITGHSAVLEQLKGRPPDRPLSIAVADQASAEKVVALTHPGLARLAERFWPGPITLLAPSQDGACTLGIRVPALRATTRILGAFGRPVHLTSANLAGEPPARTAEEVLEAFDGSVALIIDAGPVPLGEASAVVGFDGHRARVHRSGLIDADMVYRTAATKVLMVCTGNTCRSPMAEAAFRREWASRRGVAEGALLEHGGSVSSAGVHAVPGICASREALDVLAARRMNARAHRSKPLSGSTLLAADHVFAMARSHRLAVLDRLPEDLREEMAEKLLLLDPEGRDVSDPIGGDRSVYERCYEQILRAVLQRLEEVDTPPPTSA